MVSGIKEETIEIAIDSVHYWLICRIYDDVIIRMEFHKNEVCELFLHSQLVLNAHCERELKRSDYADLIYWILKHNSKLSKYKPFLRNKRSFI